MEAAHELATQVNEHSGDQPAVKPTERTTNRPTEATANQVTERPTMIPSLNEKQKKVAIVGGHPSRRRAPFKNQEWDIWVFSSRRWRPPRITRWFEIHAMTDLRQQLASVKRGRRSFGNYMRFMRRLDCPVYMMKVHPRIPNSVKFPKDELVDEFGHCFTSTLAFLIALAIREGYEEIGLWGIRLRGSKYGLQRPAIRYLLSLAKQRGIKVRLAGGLKLSIPQKPKFVKTRVLYAYGWRSRHAWWRERVRKRKRGRKRRR